MKRGAKIIVVLLAVLLLCSCVLRKEEDDGGFYAKTPYTYGHNWPSHYIVEVLSEQEQVNISETSSIQFSVGVGRAPFKNTEGHYGWLMITAENCSINGEVDAFCRDYADFYQSDIYVYKEGEPSLFGLGSTPIYPQYYETIEITFPQQDCSGLVSLELFSTHEMEYTGREVAAVTLIFKYTVKNGVLTLSEYDSYVSIY